MYRMYVLRIYVVAGIVAHIRTLRRYHACLCARELNYFHTLCTYMYCTPYSIWVIRLGCFVLNFLSLHQVFICVTVSVCVYIYVRRWLAGKDGRSSMARGGYMTGCDILHLRMYILRTCVLCTYICTYTAQRHVLNLLVPPFVIDRTTYILRY